MLTKRAGLTRFGFRFRSGLSIRTPAFAFSSIRGTTHSLMKDRAKRHALRRIAEDSRRPAAPFQVLVGSFIHGLHSIACDAAWGGAQAKGQSEHEQ